MTKSVRHRLAHVCILVKDIDQAIEHYSNILSVVNPDLLKRKVEKKENVAGKDKYFTAFFPAVGDACDIQLIQPLNPESPLYKRLESHGEGLHHIAFTTSNLEDTFQQLKEKRISLSGDRFVANSEKPDLRWVWILPGYAQGALIEVMDSYKVIDGELVRDP
jgi:catechol 2,3-dioxygenase-like lactoylglutathione lyase family enzyme